MSNKPPKKSDENKRWRKPRRDRGSRISPEYHPIITEGSKTEPLYFEGLKKAVNQKYTGRIEIVGLGEGANTLSILDTAEKVQLRSGGKYRHIWIVYDKDDFPEDDFDNTFFRCQKLSSSSDSVTYHALWSNECIELWFLLHFEYLQSSLHRDFYYPKLTKYRNHLKQQQSGDKMITTERIQQHKAMLSSEMIPSLKTTASFDATFQFDTTNVMG
ncbi:MAG: RloB domain-containing protein [Oscillospiraceae bacterium]|nr:RloB domain-containing protein [Oscillospiraceae bacterium]